MKRTVLVFGAAAALLLVGALEARDFTLGWSNCPEKIEGPPGSTQTLETYVTLTTTNNPGTDGAQGWSLSIEVVNADVITVTLKGVTVDTVYCEDDDADPSTACIEHLSYIQDLGDATTFTKIANKATYWIDPARKGAISAVVLRGQEKMTLQPTGTANILKLVISTTLPAEGDPELCKEVVLKFENNFKSSVSQPVKNVITYGGASITPTTSECRILFCRVNAPTPEFNFAIVPAGGTPAPDGDTTVEQDVDEGTVIFPVHVLLSTANLDPAGSGPEGWSLGIAHEACMTVDKVTLKGVTVDTYFCEDADADPITPCIEHPSFIQDLGAAEVFLKVADKADGCDPSPINDCAQKGVISAVVLRSQELMVLHPNATDTILRIDYKLTVGEGETVICKSFILQGLKSAVSQPVENLVSFHGTSMYPNKEQGLILKLTGKKPRDVPFRHGDPNNDGKTNIADAVRIVMAVVPESGPTLDCPVTGDVDDNGRLELPDAVYLLENQFRHGPAIVDPVVCTKIIGKGVSPATCPTWKEYCP